MLPRNHGSFPLKPRSRLASWLLAILGMSLSPATALPLASDAPLKLLVPAYFYPGQDDLRWPALAQAAGQVPLTAILNPGNGPGQHADSHYVQAISDLRAAGGQIVGYVHCQYGKRALDEVIADIERYAQLYEIDGIFVDEMSSTAEADDLAYFSALYQSIKRLDPSWQVIGNPGARPDPKHLDHPTLDTVVQFENTSAAWQSRPVLRWSKPYARNRLAELVHSVPDRSMMQLIVNASIESGIGHLFVTDDVMENPWDTLPTWWPALVAAVATINSNDPR